MRLVLDIDVERQDDKVPYWNVNFHITHENDIAQFVPIVIYENELPDPVEESTVVGTAARRALGGQIQIAYAFLRSKEHGDTSHDTNG